MFSDCHMHTWFSEDSDADPESMVCEAIKRGLKTICITDHEEKDWFCGGQENVIDMEKYISTIRGLQEKYCEQIQILLGVEVSMQPHLGGYLAEYAAKYPFDFIIGSTHVVEGKDPYYDDYFKGRTDKEGYGLMFEETLKNLHAIKDFDTLGHLDYVVRYGRTQEQAYSYREFADQIDEILRFLVENGKGLELNTAGLKYGLPFAHPHPEVLKRYRELGGEIITIGADAHKPEHIAYDFDKVKDILTGCGFKFYTVFMERKPVFREIL